MVYNHGMKMVATFPVLRVLTIDSTHFDPEHVAAKFSLPVKIQTLPESDDQR